MTVSPLDNSGAGGMAEEVVCTGTFFNPEPGALAYGDLYASQFGNPGNYDAAVTGANKMTLSLAEGSPWGSSSLCKGVYAEEDSQTSFSTAGNQAALGQVQADNDWVEQQIHVTTPPA